MHTTGMPLSMHVPGGEQRAARGSGDVSELDRDGCVGAGHAVDARGSVVADAPTRRLDQRRGEGLGVAHPDADGRHRVTRRHEALLDREWSDGGKHVATVLTVGDLRPIWPDLEEQVLDVRVVAGRQTHHGDLRRQGVTASHAVDLPFVW
jgi:hypothetical protein